MTPRAGEVLHFQERCLPQPRRQHRLMFPLLETQLSTLRRIGREVDCPFIALGQIPKHLLVPDQR